MCVCMCVCVCVCVWVWCVCVHRGLDYEDVIIAISYRHVFVDTTEEWLNLRIFLLP